LIPHLSNHSPEKFREEDVGIGKGFWQKIFGKAVNAGQALGKLARKFAIKSVKFFRELGWPGSEFISAMKKKNI